jgi:hypothetical protein
MFINLLLTTKEGDMIPHDLGILLAIDGITHRTNDGIFSQQLFGNCFQSFIKLCHDEGHARRMG